MDSDKQVATTGKVVDHQQSKAVVTSQLLQPLSPEAAKEMMERYQAYVAALLDDNDYQIIDGKKAKKKSAWRKLALANSLSVHTISERREDFPNGDFAYHFVCEAVHPNGRVITGSGSCAAYEKAVWLDGKWQAKKKQFENNVFVGFNWVIAEPNSIHNVRATAETRAWNRAVSNLIAAGEVSAEELDQGRDKGPEEPKQDGVCVKCQAPGKRLDKIGKNGKPYTAFACSKDKQHFFFSNQPEFEQSITPAKTTEPTTPSPTEEPINEPENETKVAIFAQLKRLNVPANQQKNFLISRFTNEYRAENWDGILKGLESMNPEQ